MVPLEEPAFPGRDAIFHPQTLDLDLNNLLREVSEAGSRGRDAGRRSEK